MMKAEDLLRDIIETSNLALKSGMGTDELVISLLSNAVVAAKHLGLSKDFCEDEFDSAIEDIYETEEEAEEKKEEQKRCNCSCTRTDLDESANEQLKMFIQGLSYKKPTSGG